MNFDPPDSVKPLLARIAAFVAEHVVPAEHEVLDHGFTPRRRGSTSCARDASARACGGRRSRKQLGGLGLGLVEHGLVSEQLGRSPLGHYVFGCQAPDAGNLEILHKYGTPEQQKTLARAAREGRASLVLLDDRARKPRLEPDDAVVHRAQGRRRLRHRRPQVVHVVGRRRGVRDRDGGDQPRGGAARPRVDDHRADRLARLRARAQHQDHGRGRRRLGEPRRDPLPRRARAGDEPARPRRRGLPDRAGATRSGPHPPLHALDRHVRARVRHDVPAHHASQDRPTTRRSR